MVFLYQKDGMEKQFNTLSNQGLLSYFAGMLADAHVAFCLFLATTILEESCVTS